MWLAVPFGPLIRILQAKIRGQVDNTSACLQQLSCQRMCDTMGGGEENHITGAECCGIRDTESQLVIVTSEVRIHIRHLDPVFGAGGDHGYFRLGVLGQQTQQLDSGVACAANDSDLDHELPLAVER